MPPTSAPARIPAPHAISMASATSDRVTSSASAYWSASVASAVRVLDRDGNSSSGRTPVRGTISHSISRATTIRRRTVAGRSVMRGVSRGRADLLPDPLAQPPERVGRHHLVAARAGQGYGDAVDDAAGPRRHHEL